MVRAPIAFLTRADAWDVSLQTKDKAFLQMASSELPSCGHLTVPSSSQPPALLPAPAIQPRFRISVGGEGVFENGC